MRILYLHQYFRHPQQAGPYRSFYLAQALVEQGHEVTMITAHNEPTGTIVNLDGITVYYLSIPYRNEFSAIKRYKAFLHFVWKGFLLMRKLKNYEAVYATSTPLTVGILGLAAKWLWKKPYVFEVRDLWPEAPIQLGYLKNPISRKLALWLENLVYTHASGVVTLSPPNLNYIQNKWNIPAAMIPNLAIPTEMNNAYPETDIVIGYFGTLGKANGLDKLLELASVADESMGNNLKIVVAGDGALKDWFLRELLIRKIKCVTYLGYLEPIEFKKELQKIHFGYVSFRDEPILEHCSPNKFFDYLAAGIPAIFNYGGWLAELTQNHCCGLLHKKGLEKDLIVSLQQFLIQKDNYKELKNNALNLAKAYTPEQAGLKLNMFLHRCI